MPRTRLWGQRIGVATVLCVSLAGGADARGLLGLFAGEQDPAPTPPTTVARDLPEPSDHTRPVAWISALRNVADPVAEPYGYVKVGTRIDLGSQGEITLTWLAPCREEIITGGVVTVTPTGPRVSGAPAPHSRALSCQPLDQVLPGIQAQQRPVAVNASEPLFLWPSQPGASARVTLVATAGNEPAEVWSATVYGNAAAYPHEAQRIDEGKAYTIRATLDNGTVYEATFSYDPDLRYSNAPINALVLLR